MQVYSINFYSKRYFGYDPLHKHELLSSWTSKACALVYNYLSTFEFCLFCKKYKIWDFLWESMMKPEYVFAVGLVKIENFLCT